MRLVRTATALAVAGSLFALGSSQAATTKLCNQVVDDKGDADQGLLSPSSQPAWDIVSADVATDKTMITTVIRVDKLSKTVSDDPVGSQWRFDFTVDGIKLYTQATTTPFGDKFVIGYTDTTSHAFASSGATGAFDVDKSEVRVSAPLASITTQATIKAGSKLTTLAASAGDYVNVAGDSPSASFEADGAEGAKDYVAGTATCVIVGK